MMHFQTTKNHHKINIDIGQHAFLNDTSGTIGHFCTTPMQPHGHVDIKVTQFVLLRTAEWVDIADEMKREKLERPPASEGVVGNFILSTVFKINSSLDLIKLETKLEKFQSYS